MKNTLKINFVSDVTCPWCAVGLYSLLTALTALDRLETDVDLTFEPFELNRAMPAAGQNLQEHVQQKYGATREQSLQTREMIRERSAEVGFRYNMNDDSRIYNTFDAHRLLHWSLLQGRQRELKERLLAAYLSEGRNPSDHETLVELAEAAGLDAEAARDILRTDAYANEVREREEYWLERGVYSVPTIVLNDQEAVVGGQPPEVFESVIRRHLLADA
ncbi:DsbA family oxidoreductase [Proteobacteria bacterium 005FR1]|nr:DsbA family oxidoreductase [Proteobacteria bacterium 005FR1]